MVLVIRIIAELCAGSWEGCNEGAFGGEQGISELTVVGTTTNRSAAVALLSSINGWKSVYNVIIRNPVQRLSLSDIVYRQHWPTSIS